MGASDRIAKPTSGSKISGLVMTLKSGCLPDCKTTEMPLPMEANTNVPGIMPKNVVIKNTG